MNAAQVMVADLVAILTLAVLAGLLVRRRIAVCRSFATYLAFTLITNRLITWWPDTFYNRRFWILKETIASAIVVLIAVELGWLVFRTLPRARRVALVLIGSIAVAAAVWSAPAGTGLTDSELGAFLSRLAAGTVWVYVGLATLATWYHLPLHQLHRSLLVGWALYLGAYGALLGLLAWRGPGFYPYVAALDPAAWAATVGLWVLAAWRHEEATALTPAAQQQLRPWLRP